MFEFLENWCKKGRAFIMSPIKLHFRLYRKNITTICKWRTSW